MNATSQDWVPAGGALRRVAVHTLEYPPLFRAARAVIQLMPRTLQAWARNQRLRAKISEGFRLVPERDLGRVQQQAVAWLLARERAGELGDYLEFGVYYGSSLATMHGTLKTCGLGHVRLFGFDSFEGLPDKALTDDAGFWKPGTFCMSEENAREYLARRGVDHNRVVLTKGWYSDTLTPALRERHQIRKASLIMIDCDLCSSAREALEFCAPLIERRAIVFFDDWFAGDLAERNLGEKKALAEFLEAHPEFRADEFGTSYAPHAKVMILNRAGTARPDGW